MKQFMQGYISTAQSTPFIYGAYGLCFLALIWLLIATLFAHNKARKTLKHLRKNLALSS